MSDLKQELVYKVALTQIPNIGSVLARRLLAYTGSLEGLFRETKKNLLKIPGIGESIASGIDFSSAMTLAEKELYNIEKYQIKTLFYLDECYPTRLKNCDDAPVMLYFKGQDELDFNHSKVVSIVGTRHCTPYGKEVCENLVADLKKRGHNPLIVSGLAYGIDITAHKAALKNGLSTIGVLGHGLGMIYPPLHARYAHDIVKQGGLLTEFIFDEGAARGNFVSRNRIIAGLCDATVVIESGVKGGALVTADMANSYNRDVFAVPGKVTDSWSAGCNKLIRTNKAALLESVDDIEYLLGWNKTNKKVVQTSLFPVEHSDDEKKIIEILKSENTLPIDVICSKVQMPVSQVSALLLTLEFAGIVKSLPGKMYALS